MTVQANDNSPIDGLSVVYSISSCELHYTYLRYSTTMTNKCHDVSLSLRCYIFPVSPPHNDVMFSVGRTSGVVEVNGTLNREASSRYLVTVNVSGIFYN